MHSLAEVTTWVEPESPHWISDTTKCFISAAHSLGLDAHAYRRMTRSGRRRTAHDLLSESEAASLITMQHGEAQRIELTSGHARAVHVRCEGEANARIIHASHGVIVCSGTIGSAELLMRSGIGPASMLDACGIEPIVASEQVGKNLADHLIMPIIFATEPRHRFPSSITMHDMTRFAVSGTGPLSCNLAEAGGLQCLASGEWFQWHVTPTHYLLHPYERAPAAMTLGVNVCNPKSRGTITLRRDSAAVPRIEIDPAYHTIASDLENLQHAIEATRAVVEGTTLRSLVREELIPGTKREGMSHLDRAIARFSQTLYHPTGTCRMGSDDQSVVDASLAVRGVDDLYVIDASVLPTIPTVNPNATVMMIARHAAKQIC
jgi:choline dehydrogenase-like flavoprotein